MSVTAHARRIAALASIVVALGGASACREPKTTNQLIAELNAPEWETRRNAADDLRTDQGVPEEAIQPLLEAAKTEKEPHALGAILITLGRSGKPEARPVIDSHIQTDDPDMRRWVGRALKYWMIATGEKKETDVFPEGWPYGTPGYPPLLAGK